MADTTPSNKKEIVWKVKLQIQASGTSDAAQNSSSPTYTPPSNDD
jgi:hypothetical protein